jgi:hypothetical protein
MKRFGTPLLEFLKYDYQEPRQPFHAVAPWAV